MTNTEKENRLVYILGPDLILSQDLQQELDKHKVMIIKTDEAEITTTDPLESIIDHIKKTLDKENIKQPSKFYIHGHGDRKHNYNNIDSQKDNNHIIELKKQFIFFTGHFLNRLQNTYPHPINFNLFSCFGGSGNKETKELKEGSSIVTNVNAKNFSSDFLDHYIQKKQLEELRLFPNSSFLEQILRNQKYSLQGGSWSYKTPDKVVTIKSERFLNPSSFNDLVEKLEKGLKHNKTLPEIVATYVNKEADGIKKSYGFKNIAKYINEDIEKLNKFRISFSEEYTKAYLIGIAHYIIYSFDKLNKQTSKEKIQIEDLSKYFGLITDYINNPIFDKWTLVHTAAQNGNTKILPELVKHKADIDKAENNGLSPLHIAAQSGHLEIVQKLLEYGANVHKSEKNGNSPLHLAALFGHLDIIQKLLEHKADVDKSENINAGALH
ncbi:MAG: ankyrin repeat domain-containing protein, partial [Janthinobacterium lividum]